MLFKMTQTYRNADEAETFVRIVDIDQDDAVAVDDETYSQTFLLATKENTTIDELVAAIESELENDNHHREMCMPKIIINHVTLVAGKEVALAVLWSMIEDKGLSIGL